MRVPLVSTKLTIPVVQRELVPRPRLVARLNQGLEGKLILVSAPAGYGKTRLLSTWAKQCPLPAAWISLDEGDNDPVRFLLYLLAALEKVMPDIGENISALLQSPQVSLRDELLASILNDIARAEKPFILVLDDYHLIHEPAIHHILIYLLNHLPPQMHLVIASRADPPLQLARLRARSELTELRLTDLCFTQEEAARFCNQVMELGLQDDQVTALTKRTEGWIAGLQMAALSLRASSDKLEWIRTLSGSQRFILDYLVEEVLHNQTEEVQSFLLKTSILDRLAGQLCDTVTGQKDSQQILEHLESANLFIIPLDDERRWYRYHQLFLDLLRKRARQDWPEKIAGWHQSASLWFDQVADFDSAIEHSLAAADFDRAAAFLEKVAEATLTRSQIYTFCNWASRLPEEVLHAHSSLALYYIWALVLSDSPVEIVEEHLNRIEVVSEAIAGKISVIRGYIHLIQGKISQATEMFQQALARLPLDEDLFRSAATYMLSINYVMTGQFEAGSQALEVLLQSNLEKKRVILAAGALCTLAEIQFRLAQLDKARHTYERVLSIAIDKSGQHLPIAARALMGLGELWREWNNLDQALTYCQEGIELAGYLREGNAVAGYVTLARIKQARGEVAEAWLDMQKAAELAQRTVGTHLDDMFVACYQRALDLVQGNLPPVVAWLEERGLLGEINLADLDQQDDYHKYHVLKYELLVLARYWMQIERPKKALLLLEQLCYKMEEQGRVHLVIESLLLSALAHQKIGDATQALSCFQRSLLLAEQGGYIRLFLDVGDAILPLLQRAARGDIVAEYAGRLLASLQAETQKDEKDGMSGERFLGRPAGFEERLVESLVEPLTEREVELLQLIAAGLSNQEIAQRLFISLPTVKWHTSNIYSKLGVRNRTQAVAQARFLGVLPD